MAKSIKNMTEDELVAENQKLMRQKDAIRDSQREINAELSNRAALRRVQAALEGLTPGQKDLVIQGVTAEAKAGGRED